MLQELNRSSLSFENAPTCTDANVKFRKFSEEMFPGPILRKKNDVDLSMHNDSTPTMETWLITERNTDKVLPFGSIRTLFRSLWTVYTARGHRERQSN